MPVGTKRKIKRGDLQRLSQIRAQEARHLLNAGGFHGAYYLIGLSVECALKACIAKATEEHEFPDLELVRESWSHKPTGLLNTAGLLREHQIHAAADPDFEANWSTVKDWDVSSRYDEHTEREARDLFEAATNIDHGVLSWIERYW